MENYKFKNQGKYIVILWLSIFIYLPGESLIIDFVSNGSPWYILDLAFYYYIHFLFSLLLVILFYINRIKPVEMLGKVQKTELISGLKLTAFIFIFSSASFYALFYPLSFIFPNFVKLWVIDLPPIIYYSEEHYPAIPNLLSFISICILAPIIEEFVFRGVLLHSWVNKWGLKKAVLISSLLFGLAHPNFLGASVFGIGMCILYLRTQNILIPILCHSVNNFLAWSLEAGMIFSNGPDYFFTLEDFREEWYIGVIAGAIVVIWVFIYLNGKPNSRIWKLPELT